ncbi:MAG TPA: hypothetical protein VNB22_17180 [Pyrinomonadaceae bacterium]|nr:hypothetical protein [Pyrinomonadaceae bacterium]
MKYRKVLIYAALTAFLCFLFLFAPRPHEDYCGKFIEVGSFGFFPLNCDSYDYIDTAKSPVKLFGENSIRQTRPLYVVLASAVGYTLSPLFRVLPFKNIAAQDELLADSFYWGFMLLNFSILVLSLLIFDRITDILTDGKFPQLAKYILAVFLVSNVVIKTSVWSAHQQMLTIFSPLLCVYWCLRIVLADELKLKNILPVSLLAGLLLMTYGNFLVMIPAIVSAILIQLYRSGKFSFKTATKLCIPATLVFGAPMALWSAILIAVNGKVYSHEATVYRQFIWIFDKLSVSFKDFYDQLISFSVLYWTSLYRTVFVFLIALVLLKTYNFFFQPKNSQSEISASRNSMAGIISIILMLYAGFFWLMGYYGERLAFTLVPVVLCLIVPELNVWLSQGKALTVKAVYVLLLFCAGIWIYCNVKTYGPFKDLSKINTVQDLRG